MQDRKMRVGIFVGDYNPEAGGAFTLIDTIRKQIIESKNTDFDYIFFNYASNNEYEKELEGFRFINIAYDEKKQKELFFVRYFKKVCRKLGLIKQKKNISTWNKLSAKENIDIMWFAYPIECDINIPFIYTVWDLGHRTTPYFPEVSKSGWKWEDRERCYNKMVFKASYILTGNEEGKKEILANYRLPEEKILVVPFPIASFCFGEETKPSFNLPEKYYFYPAQFWPHKNHICILEAQKILKEQGLEVNIVFTGSDKGNKDYILQKVKDYNLEEQVTFTGFLSEEELKWIYTHAQAMIFASLMGPNNMPPIEATFLGCPVIITDLDGHKEQLGDSALYFNGYNYQELADKITTLLDDTKIKTFLATKQKELSLEFEKINYFEQVLVKLKEFEKIRKTWGDDFNHL